MDAATEYTPFNIPAAYVFGVREVPCMVNYGTVNGQGDEGFQEQALFGFHRSPELGERITVHEYETRGEKSKERKRANKTCMSVVPWMPVVPSWMFEEEDGLVAETWAQSPDEENLLAYSSRNPFIEFWEDSGARDRVGDWFSRKDSEQLEGEWSTFVNERKGLLPH
jgi:hypothetical protein